MSDPVTITNPATFAFDVLDESEKIEHIRHVCQERPERVCIEQKKLGHCDGSCVDHGRTGINGGVPI